MPIEVREGRIKAQQGLTQRQVHARVQRLAHPLESRVGDHLELELHISRDHARTLLARATKGEHVSVDHAAQHAHLELALALLAQLVTGNFLLLLDDETGRELHVHRPDLGGALAAARAAP